MKKKKILSIALGITFAAVTMVGGSMHLFADGVDTPKISGETLEIHEEIGSKEYFNELVKKGIIIQAEVETIIEVENKLDQIYAKYEKATDEEITKLDKEVFELSEKIDGIYGKIYAAEYYEEIENAGILTKEELAQYKKAESELDKLYDALFKDNISDAEIDKMLKEEDRIMEANKAIFDKIDKYFDDIEKEIAENEYQEFLKNGGFKKGDVDVIPYNY